MDGEGGLSGRWGEGTAVPAVKQNPYAGPPLAGEAAFQVESGEKYVGICLQSHGIFFF